MKRALATALVLALGLLATTASAEEKQNPITIKPIEVFGHVSRPSVTIEISRVRMHLPATTPTLAAGTKIQEASKKDPF